MALRFVSFRYIKTIWFGLKNGRDKSAPTPCGVHVAIYLRKKMDIAVCSLPYILRTINGLCGVCWIFYYT